MIHVVHDLLELSAPDAEVTLIELDALPQPQRRLLDHGRDMTGTLEEFLAQRLTLRALHVRREGDSLYRRVLLLGGAEPAAYGAVRIDLAALPPAVRPAVEACEQPLGGLLSRAGIELSSEARGFLRTDAAAARDALGCDGPLFGRLARLSDEGGRTLADVVEILPTFEDRE